MMVTVSANYITAVLLIGALLGTMGGFCLGLLAYWLSED